MIDLGTPVNLVSFVSVDVETTGLRPSWHDRIAEIGVVQVDLTGRVEGSWATLVIPKRDLGPQHIHGITAAVCRVQPHQLCRGRLSGPDRDAEARQDT